MTPYEQTPEFVVKEFKTDSKNGLSSNEVLKRQKNTDKTNCVKRKRNLHSRVL